MALGSLVVGANKLSEGYSVSGFHFVSAKRNRETNALEQVIDKTTGEAFYSVVVYCFELASQITIKVRERDGLDNLLAQTQIDFVGNVLIKVWAGDFGLNTNAIADRIVVLNNVNNVNNVNKEAVKENK